MAAEMNANISNKVETAIKVPPTKPSTLVEKRRASYGRKQATVKSTTAIEHVSVAIT